MGTERLTWFNELSAAAVHSTLVACCAAPGWAEQVAAGRPYGHTHAVIQRSDAIVADLAVADLAEALAGHPRIGERPDASKEGTQAAAWSKREQSGVGADDAPIRRALAEANVEYERRFGHIYLVCASGRTGAELLSLLSRRLCNEPEDEWQVVRSELQKINALRLERLLAGQS